MAAAREIPYDTEACGKLETGLKNMLELGESSDGRRSGLFKEIWCSPVDEQTFCKIVRLPVTGAQGCELKFAGCLLSLAAPQRKTRKIDQKRSSVVNKSARAPLTAGWISSADTSRRKSKKNLH